MVTDHTSNWVIFSYYCGFFLDKRVELYENVKIDLMSRTKITLSGDTSLSNVEEKIYKPRNKNFTLTNK